MDSLTGASREWPTPTALSFDKSHQPGNNRSANKTIELVENWPTPNGDDANNVSRDSGEYQSLARATNQWQTPATDSFRSRGGERKDEMGLDQQARLTQWHTPDANSWKGSYKKGQREAQISEDAEVLYPSLSPDLQKSNAGETSSETDPGSPQPSSPAPRPRLNPVFVELLLGLPPFWTWMPKELRDSKRAATPSSRNARSSSQSKSKRETKNSSVRFESPFWRISHRFDPDALPLADRHYNRRKVGSNQFVPPGKCLVLLAPRDGMRARALWVSSFPKAEYVKHEWAGAWVNTLFRNEGAGLSSELIRDAIAITRKAWGDPPPLGMITFIDRSKVHPKKDFGYCYLKAGFNVAGETKGGLLALQMLPVDMPEAAK